MKAQDFLTQDKLDELQFNTDDNNGIIDDEFIANLMEEYHTKQLNLCAVICSSRDGSIKFVKGQKVCSYGDKTTFGYIDSWDEAENCWKLTTDIEGSYKWFAVDEPRFFENYI